MHPRYKRCVKRGALPSTEQDHSDRWHCFMPAALENRTQIMVQQWLQNSLNVNVKGTFPVGYSNQAVNFFFLLEASRQKLLLFLSIPGFTHQNGVLPYRSAALPWTPKVRSNKGRWHQVPVLRRLKSRNSGHKQKRDPNPNMQNRTFFKCGGWNH